MIPAVVAFDFEKSYEKDESSELCHPSVLNRPTMVFHVDAFAFQPCTNRMIGCVGGGGGGGVLLKSGSVGSVIELHAPSTMREEPASERRADRIDEPRIRVSMGGTGSDDAAPIA